MVRVRARSEVGADILDVLSMALAWAGLAVLVVVGWDFIASVLG